MNFNDYQHAAARTAVYPDQGDNPFYPAMGLGGEAGEVLEHMKKAMRDDASTITPERSAALKKELGDVLWYVAALATELDLSLGDIAQGNVDKLRDRKQRGKLHGSGDDR